MSAISHFAFSPNWPFLTLNPRVRFCESSILVVFLSLNRSRYRLEPVDSQLDTVVGAGFIGLRNKLFLLHMHNIESPPSGPSNFSLYVANGPRTRDSSYLSVRVSKVHAKYILDIYDNQSAPDGVLLSLAADERNSALIWRHLLRAYCNNYVYVREYPGI